MGEGVEGVHADNRYVMRTPVYHTAAPPRNPLPTYMKSASTNSRASKSRRSWTPSPMPM